MHFLELVADASPAFSAQAAASIYSGATISIAVSLLLLLLLFLLDCSVPKQWWWYIRLYHHKCSLPPGSMGWPLLGETMEFLEPHSATSCGKFMEKHIKRYGNVFKASLFGQPTIISADPELNRFILLNEDRLFQCSYPSTISGILGKWSMLVLVGEEHKRMRSIAINFMSTHKLKDFFFDDIEHHVLLTLQSWTEGRILLAQEEAKKFTFNLMARQIASFNPGEIRTQDLMRDYYTFMKGVIAPPFNIPGTAYHKAIKSRAKILDTLRETLKKRVEAADEVHNDLLGVVMESKDLSTDQILDLLLNMLFAGHETSSVALTLALKFLADTPKVVEELRAEHRCIREARDSEGRKNLCWEDYKKMTFTNCVINETLRLGNVVRFVHRKALQDVFFKDFVIPKGWKVLPVFCAVHLDSCVYRNPLKFDPWRWQQQDPTYFTPFGGGSRLCAGAHLAKLEIAIFLHHLVLEYDWELVETDTAMAFPFVEFEKGLPLKIHKVN